MRTKAFLFGLAVMALPSMLISCGGDDDNGSTDNPNEETVFTPSLASTTYFASGIDFPAEGGEVSIQFSTNKSWRVTSTESWCSVSPQNGKASDRTISIVVSSNGEIDNRECVVTLSVGGQNNYISIRQAGLNNGTVNVAQAGALPQILGDRYNEITELTIKGQLNGTDFELIRRMAMGKLTTLDITDVRIVAGGDSYAYDGLERQFTKDDEVTALLFYGCLNLKELKLPQDIKRIGQMAFCACRDLQALDIPANVTEIDEYAFSGCESLQTITIPDKVQTLAKGVFSGCKQLKEVHFPQNLALIDEGAFGQCESLKSVYIPASVTAVIGAFGGCTQLQTVEVHAKEIVNMAFANCSSLNTVILGDEVKTIDSSTFHGCSSLRTLTIPASVERIVGIFGYGVTLSELHLKASTPPEFSTSNDVIFNCTLYVPRGSREAYASDSQFKAFKSIVEE